MPETRRHGREVDVANAFESAEVCIRDEIHNALRQIVKRRARRGRPAGPVNGALDRIKGIALATIAKLRVPS